MFLASAPVPSDCVSVKHSGHTRARPTYPSSSGIFENGPAPAPLRISRTDVGSFWYLAVRLTVSQHVCSTPLGAVAVTWLTGQILPPVIDSSGAQPLGASNKLGVDKSDQI